MIETISDVVANLLCTNCGTCAGVCSTDALTMRETPGGEIIPELDSSLCTDCGLCHMVCPQIHMPAGMAENLSDPYIGPVQNACLGQATDPALAATGQTGGLTRTLVACALQCGMVDAAVCVVDDPTRALRPKVALLTTPADTLAVSRSKYCPVPINTIIRELRESHARVAYVGLGCHMQGLHLALERLPWLRKRIVLKLGLFCDRVLTYAAADYLVRCAGESPGNVTEFDYRHKSWQGWPGDIRVVSHGGRVKNVSRYKRVDTREVFTPIHCRLCVDKLNALADISLGDPHGLASGTQVPTAALIRTPAGHDLLRRAEESGKITVSPADGAEIARHQKMRRRASRCCLYGREMLRRGNELPAFLRVAPFEVTRERSASLYARLSARFAVACGTASGTRRVGRIPAWVLSACVLPARQFKVWSRLAVRVLRRMGLWRPRR